MWKTVLLAIVLPSFLASAVPLAPAVKRADEAHAHYYEQFSPDVLIYHGSRSGLETLDGGIRAGNPFATAFIDALETADQSVAAFTDRMVTGTGVESYGFQSVDTNADLSAEGEGRPILREGEKRMALVLIVADYAPDTGLASLNGASYDAMRVSAALQQAGFEVTLSLNNPIGYTQELLSVFASRSQQADISLIYTTGHGIEYSGVVRLIMADFDPRAGRDGLEAASLTLPQIAAAGQARALNLVLYAGCRNNPFGF